MLSYADPGGAHPARAPPKKEREKKRERKKRERKRERGRGHLYNNRVGQNSGSGQMI